MKTKRSPEATPHRLFRAMVLMSGGVALGCGGLSTGEQSGESGGNNQKGGSAGSVSTGGSSSGGSAGEATNGGSSGLVIQLGGSGGTAGTVATAGAGGTPTIDPLPCPPQQWDCTDAIVDCDYPSTGWALPSGCKCDDARPLSSDACATDEWFVCRNATATSDYTPLAEAIPFDCTCLPQQQNCAVACELANANTVTPLCSQAAQSILCGCAVIYLK